MNTAVLLLVVASLGSSAALSVIITPEHEKLREEELSLTVRCVANAPITHCQFRVVNDERGVQNPVVDLSPGRASSVSHFKYEGNGLLAGHCGATIAPEALPDYRNYGTVECRVRSEKSEWVYSTMTVLRYEWEKIPLTIDSRLVVVRPGGEVNLLFQAWKSLSACKLKHPHESSWIDLPSRLTCVTEADSVCHHGMELKEGHCGATIKNITDRSNGVYWFRVETFTGLEVTQVQVIVTKPPSTPMLSVNTALDSDGFITLRAVCTVVGSRPAANVTWVLGGEVVTGGKIVYFPSDTWVRQYEEQNNTQQLTLRMSTAMNGKYLSCVVRHVALTSPMSSNKVEMVVPKLPSIPVLSSNTTVNIDGTATLRAVCIVVGSQPAANITWILGGEVVTGGNIGHVRIDQCTRQFEYQNNNQQLTLRMEMDMDGKYLNCIVHYNSFPFPISSNKVKMVVPSAAMVEHRVRLLHMAELHQVQMQVEEHNALAAKDNAMAAKENALAAQAHTRAEEALAKNAEEELEMQRALRKTKLQQLAGSTTVED